MTQSDDEVISAAELARRLGVDRSAVRRYERDHIITPHSQEWNGLRREPKYLASDVEKFLTAQQERKARRTRKSEEVPPAPTS